MVTITEALRLIDNEISTLNEETVEITSATKRVLSQHILAPINLPPFDQSAMDGYAINFKTQYDSFNIVGEIQAGSPQDYSLEPGQGVRIFTGAKVPESANVVIMQEDVTVFDKRITLTKKPNLGQHIRKTGEQIKTNEIALKKDTMLSPSAIGFICSLGLTEVMVYAQPKIEIIATGSELVLPGNKLAPGQIYQSNSFMLKSAVEFYQLGHTQIQCVEDSLEKTTEAIKIALDNVDFVLISGGISVGEYDYVERALKQLGVQGIFHKVRQKPGNPLYFGKLKNKKYVFALPGNPSAAMTSFLIYVLPALRKAAGFGFEGLKKIQMPIDQDYSKTDDRAHLLKSKIINNKIHILGGQNSDILNSFTDADSLALISEANALTKNNELIDAYLL